MMNEKDLQQQASDVAGAVAGAIADGTVDPLNTKEVNAVAMSALRLKELDTLRIEADLAFVLMGQGDTETAKGKIALVRDSLAQIVAVESPHAPAEGGGQVPGAGGA